MPCPQTSTCLLPRSLYRPVSCQLSQCQDLLINPGAQMGRAFALDGWAPGLSFSGHKSEALEQEV